MESHSRVAPVSQVIYKKRSFLSTLILGLSAITVTVIVCLVAIVLYGMNIADRRIEDFIGHRQTVYHSQLSITARLVPDRYRGGLRPSIEVQNNGDEVVSFLSMNVTVVDESGNPLDQWTVWGATPIALDGELRGPLLPSSKRRVLAPTSHRMSSPGNGDDLRVEVEVTDIRIWVDHGGVSHRVQEI